MNKNQLQLAKYLPAINFILVPTISILIGWLIGISFGRTNPEIWHNGNYRPSPSQAKVLGGIAGGLWGLTIGSFLSFGGFGLITSWVWGKKYPDMKSGQTLLLVLGWMFAPAVICLFTMIFLLSL